MFHNLWGGFVDESCRANMPKAEACLYGELGKRVVNFIVSLANNKHTLAFHHFYTTFLKKTYILYTHFSLGKSVQAGKGANEVSPM